MAGLSRTVAESSPVEDDVTRRAESLADGRPIQRGGCSTRPRQRVTHLSCPTWGRGPAGACLRDGIRAVMAARAAPVADRSAHLEAIALAIADATASAPLRRRHQQHAGAFALLARSLLAAVALEGLASM